MKMELKEIGCKCVNWNKLTENRFQRQTVVKVFIPFHSIRRGELYLNDCKFSMELRLTFSLFDV